MEPNRYSHRWYEFFHGPMDEARITREMGFISDYLPLPDFNTILDVCCGTGRHARVLSSRGYSVSGVERDPSVVAQARQLGPQVEYIQADIRDYQPQRSGFDGIIVMGQSFGYFDAATNRTLLGRLTAGLRNGGRMVLDLWNPEFFRLHQDQRQLQTQQGTVLETKCVRENRLFVHLDYPDNAAEEFEWELFTPAEMQLAAHSLGLELITSCTRFDRSVSPSPTDPGIQFVLERVP